MANLEQMMEEKTREIYLSNEQLRKSEEKYRTLVEEINDGFYITKYLRKG